jgi:hypothetical protein
MKNETGLLGFDLWHANLELFSCEADNSPLCAFEVKNDGALPSYVLDTFTDLHVMALDMDNL